MADVSSEYTYSVEQFIASEDTTLISYNKLSIFEKIDMNYMITHNVLNDYIDELKKASSEYILDDLLYLKYKQKPKLLAYDCYGSTEMYFIILKLNNMYDVKQFNKRTVRLIKKDKLENILSLISQSQSNILRTNKMKIE